MSEPLPDSFTELKNLLHEQRSDQYRQFWRMELAFSELSRLLHEQLARKEERIAVLEAQLLEANRLLAEQQRRSGLPIEALPAETESELPAYAVVRTRQEPEEHKKWARGRGPVLQAAWLKPDPQVQGMAQAVMAVAARRIGHEDEFGPEQQEPPSRLNRDQQPEQPSTLQMERSDHGEAPRKGSGKLLIVGTLFVCMSIGGVIGVRAALHAHASEDPVKRRSSRQLAVLPAGNAVSPATSVPIRATVKPPSEDSATAGILLAPNEPFMQKYRHRYGRQPRR